MNKVLATCAAIFSLFVVFTVPRFAAAAEPQVQRQARPPAQTQGQPQAAPPGTQEATVTPLPHVRTAPRMLQKPPPVANVDLRPDVVSTVQTEPSIPNGGTYDYFHNNKKPLKMTAVVENAGLTKADKVVIHVTLSPFKGWQVGNTFSDFNFTYPVDLGPGEAVSLPFDVLVHYQKVMFFVKADFAGGEKKNNKANNNSAAIVTFVH